MDTDSVRPGRSEKAVDERTVPCGRTPSRSNFVPNTKGGASGFDDDLLPVEKLRAPLPRDEDERDELDPRRLEEPRRDAESRESSSPPKSSSDPLLRLERDDRELDPLREDDEPSPPPLEPLERDDPVDMPACTQSGTTRSTANSKAAAARLAEGQADFE